MLRYKCPITGKELQHNLLNGYLQPVEKYNSSVNPEELNERIIAAGYDPNRYYGFDGAIPVLAYIVKDGERLGKIEPSNDRGKFGGWQIIPTTVKMNGILANWDVPNEYEIEWLV